MPGCVLVACCAALATSTTDALSPPEQRVLLAGQRGALDLSGEQPVLRFQALAKSKLGVPVEAVEVGVVFARTDEELELADPVAAYTRAAPPAGEKPPVAGVRGWLPVTLPPGGEAALTLEQPLRLWHPEPNAFVTHVLGYRLADWDVPLLEALLASEVPADEVAVVETLALTGDAARKLAVRERWGNRPALVAAFAALAQAPAPAAPRFSDCLRRVLAIRALGVLGGEQAKAALEALRAAPMLDAFDDALLVVSVARAQGSPMEAAMAYAVPADAEHLRDVVTLALADVALTPAAAAAAPPAPETPVAASPAAANAPAAPATDEPRSGRFWPWLFVAALVLLAGVVVARRGDRSGR